MSNSEEAAALTTYVTTAAIVALLTLTGVMLLALFSRTAPHPPLEVLPFAIGPFLGASLAIGAAAFHLVRRGAPYGNALALLFALTAAVSFGPQKYFDPKLSLIWPSVIIGQLAVIAVVVCSIVAMRRKRATL